MTTEPPVVEELTAVAYRVPTAGPEADGTLEWDATTMVVVHAHAGGESGLGWTYAHESCVDLVDGVLAPVVCGRSVADVPASWLAMHHRIRNLGRPGLVSCAISAVDTALWDLAARVAGMPLARLLGRVHDEVELYASGGFTTYGDAQFVAQLQEWTKLEIPRVKIKIGESWGSAIERDLARVRRTRTLVGDGTEVYVDANGGYTVGQARRVAAALAEHGVTWFEEPVSSDDLDGLRLVRSATRIDVTAGEYGYDLPYFARMVEAGAVDCLQVDVTRCGGYTEWARIAAVAAAHNLQVSAHCAPNLTAPVAVATANFRHLEWFADHDRIERTYLDGALDPRGGRVRPSMSTAGHGLRLRADEIAEHLVR